MRTLDLDKLLWRIVKTEDRVGFLVYLTVNMRGGSLVGPVRLAQQTVNSEFRCVLV